MPTQPQAGDRDGAPHAHLEHGDPEQSDPEQSDPEHGEAEQGGYAGYGEQQADGYDRAYSDGPYTDPAYQDPAYRDPAYHDPAAGPARDYDEMPFVDGLDEGANDDEEQAYQDDPFSQAYENSPEPRRRRWLVVLSVFVVVLLIVGLVAFERVKSDVLPGGPLGARVSVHIPSGSSTPAIARILAKAGVVRGSEVFELYLKLESTTLYPGTYSLPTNEPYAMAMAALEKGPVFVQRKFVVPEGFDIAKMAARVAGLGGIGITKASFLAAARDGQVSSPYLPPGKTNLEGLLFPATYTVQQGEPADTLVQYMAQTFNYHATSLGLKAAAAKLGYTPYQVVTVASIVEREAKFNRDRGLIASVIYNRLARNMPIGAESTLDYAVGKQGEVDDTLPNPYNTLLNKGLPPTPISSPGIPSLLAAMHPPKTTYLYWVEVNPDGQTEYASTEAGFKQLQAKCRAAKLC